MGKLKNEDMDFVHSDKTRQYLEFINSSHEVKTKE